MLAAVRDYSIVLLDPEGRVTSWNPSAEQMLGYTEAEIVGQHFSRFFYLPVEASATRAEQHLLTAVATGKCEVQRWCLRNDGSKFWATVGITPVRSDRTLIGYCMLTRDSTESGRIAQDLERSEAYLAEGQRISHTGSWAWNPVTKELFWSLEHFRILGLDPEVTEPSDEVFFARVHPQDRNTVEQTFAKALRDSANFDLDYRIVRPDGTIRYIDSQAHPVRDASGLLIEYVGTIIDVTERKLAEEDARKANARVKMVLDSITDKFFALDSQWQYTFFNEHAEEQLEALGKVPSDLIGRVLWDEFPRPESEQALRQAMTERKVITEEHYYAPLNEWVENRIYPSPDGGVAIFQRYVTERKRAEDALRTAQDELARVSRVMTMGILAASIAHEVNQPLTAVITNSNACMRWLSGATPNLVEAQDALVRIVRDGQRASQVIARIRALFKETPIYKESIDINQAIQQVITLAVGELNKHNVILHTQLASDVSPALGDRVQLQQVVLNLVMNAIEAMKTVEDRPRELGISTQQEDLDHVRVSVRDTGIGFGSEGPERIFEPFYTTKPQGMGMGLSISRTIIDAHGGRLWATDNSNGPGATFHLTLPMSTTIAPNRRKKS